MFGFSIGASTIGLGELTESNRPVCDDALSGLVGSGSNNYFYRSSQFRFEYIDVLYNIHERFLNC
jgi:hypothetical protein